MSANIKGNWAPLPFIGPACKGKYLRVSRSFTTGLLSAEDVTTRLIPGSGRKVVFPAGAIGLCYAANLGTLFVGFMRDFKTPPQGVSPTRMDYCIQVSLSQISSLEIAAG